MTLIPVADLVASSGSLRSLRSAVQARIVPPGTGAGF